MMLSSVISERNIREDLNHFFSDNKFFLGIVSAVFFLFYGSHLYMPNVGIDTAIMVDNPGTIYNWTEIGRQGLILTKILFGNLNFNPYYSSTLGLVFILIALMCWNFLLYRVGNIKGVTMVLFSLIFIIHPIFVEQFYFTLQILEFSFAMMLVPLALLVEFEGAMSNKKYLGLISILMMVWAFSSYQSFILLYVAGAIFCYLLIYRKLTLANDSPPLNIFYFKIIIRLIVTFFIALIVNVVITKLFFSGSEYLDAQILWGKFSLESCVKNILGHVKQIIVGEGIFYSWGYAVSMCLMVVSVIPDIFRKKSSIKWIWVCAIILLECMPFILTIYLGGAPTVRTQLLIPFVIACNIILCEQKLNIIKTSIGNKGKTVLMLLGTAIILTQGNAVQRLYYTDDARFSGDLLLAQSLSNTINTELGSQQQKPLAVVGVKKPFINPAAVNGEMIGLSLFSWGASVPPHYLHSNGSITSFMRSVGLDFNGIASESQMMEARKIAFTMPLWPDKGSVFDAGSFIVIKLSEDEFYADDILVPSTQKVVLGNVVYETDKARWSVDSAEISGDTVVVKGWCLKEGTSSLGSKVNVYLFDESHDEYLQIGSAVNSRADVTASFGGSVDYTSSGFIAKGDMSKLDVAALEKYKIVLGYQKDSEKIFVDTGKYLSQ